MSTIEKRPGLTRDIQANLSGLRWRIRAYVWVEGLALATVWLCVTFWIGLALDYLPILVGATEMPRAARATLLVIVAGIFAWILYRWVLRRAFVRLADQSMAILLERRFSDFHDSLVTAVEMVHRPDHATDFNEDMLQHTRAEARSGIRDVHLSRVFNFRPLLSSVGLALVLVVTVAGFSLAKPDTFRMGFERLYLLKDTPWPRSARIEVVGILTDRSALPAESRAALPVIPFQNRIVKVAKGSSVELLRVADASSDVSVVPDYCYFYYRMEDGNRGRVRMTRIGGVDAQYQSYSFRDKPLERIVSTISFDVVGYDHRLSGFKLQLVNNPAVIQTTLDCEYPEYTGLERDVALPFTPGMKLPMGSRVTIHCSSNKPLKNVYVLDDATHKVHTVELAADASGGESDLPRQFSYQVSELSDNLGLEFTLRDADDVIGQETHRVFITATPDAAPAVTARLNGVSTVITPDVIMPYVGTVTDDFGVVRTWFRIERRVGKADPIIFEQDFVRGIARADAPNELKENPNAFESSLDFRTEGGQEGGFKLAAKDQVIVTVRALDNCALEQGANEGTGERLQFDVVTPGELLTMLEAREIGLRRRFEQLIEEMTATRDSLLHVSAELGGGVDSVAEPGDAADEPGDKPLTPAEKVEREKALRLLRVQHASAQSQKIAQEILGVAASFTTIRLELTNNRIDTKDRKDRLEEKIAQPLRDVGESMFPAMDTRLAEMEKVLELADKNSVAAKAAVEQADDILAELNSILQDMLDIEDYNELIDIVRSLIEEQKKVTDEAKKQRLKGLFDE